MTHWKIGYMYWCVTISDKHRASWFISTVCMKASVSPNITRQVLANHVCDNTITSAARLNSDANEWNSSKNFFQTNVFFRDRQIKFQLEILHRYWKLKWWSYLSYQHYYFRIPLLSLVSLSEINVWSNSAADKLFDIVFETIKLFNDFLFPQGWLDDDTNELWEYWDDLAGGENGWVPNGWKLMVEISGGRVTGTIPHIFNFYIDNQHWHSTALNDIF